MIGKRKLRSGPGYAVIRCGLAALLLTACSNVDDPAGQGAGASPMIPPQDATPMQPQPGQPVAGTSAPPGQDNGAPTEMMPAPGTGGSDPSSSAAGASGAA